MQYDWVLKEVRVVRPEGILEADVAVRGGRLERIGGTSGVSAKHEVAGAGRFLLPGLIDSCVQLTSDSVSDETIQTATRAALRGGVTTLLELGAVQQPLDSEDALRKRQAQLEAESLCDFRFILTAHAGNAAFIARALERGESRLVRVDPLPHEALEAWIQRIDGLLRSSEALICLQPEASEIVEKIEEGFRVHGLPARHTVAHPEGAALQAWDALLSCLDGCGALSGEGVRVHVPAVSSALERRLLRSYRTTALSLGVTAGHLALTQRDLSKLGGQHGKVVPPLRLARDRKALQSAVRLQQLAVLSSGHVPVAGWEKELPYWEAPSGMPMLETALRVYLMGVSAGWLTLERLAWMGAERPAELFGLNGKGRLEEGWEADMVLLSDEPAGRVDRGALSSECGWSLLEGEVLPVGAAGVWRRGECRVLEGVNVEGDGKRP